MTKRLTRLGCLMLVLLLLIISMSACSRPDDPEESTDSGTSSTEPSDGEEPGEPEETNEDGEPVETDEDGEPAETDEDGDVVGTDPDDNPQPGKTNPSTPTAKPSSGKNVVADKGSFKVNSVDEPFVTGSHSISVMYPGGPSSGDMNKQSFTAAYEKKTGIKVNYRFYVYSDVFTAYTAMMQSGNLPDIFMGGPGSCPSTAQVQTYGKQGFYADLAPYLETWAPNVTARIKANDYANRHYFTTNSTKKIYDLPRLSLAKNEMVESISTVQVPESQLLIRKDWLEELGLSMPKTEDEFKKVCDEFTNSDPDGNGKKDTYGFGLRTWMPYLWNPWGLNMSYYISQVIDSDGTVHQGTLTDQYREGIRFWNGIWTKNQWNKDMIGASGAAMKAALQNTGIIMEMSTAIDTLFSDKELANWAALPWPKGKNTGKFTYNTASTAYAADTVTPNVWLVSAKTKSVEACLRWIDYLYTVEGALLWSYGPVNQAYSVIGGKHKLVADSDKKVLTASAQSGVQTFGNIKSVFLAKNTAEMSSSEKFVSRINKEINSYNPGSSRKYIMQYVIYERNEAETAALTNLSSVGSTAWGYQAIRGEANVETEWNSYLTTYSKDYAQWKTIWQGIFKRVYK